MTKVFISKKQIVSIEEFMENYIGKEYDGNHKLTHKEMYFYLQEKGIKIPKKVSYDFVDKESILNGTYILVKDHTSQILIYHNPRLKSFDTLLQELRTEANLVTVSKNRRRILNEMGYRESFDGVFENDPDEEMFYPLAKYNRNKQFVKCRKNL